MKVIFNANEYCKVRLTEEGKFIYYRRYKERPHCDDKGYTKFQVHHLMNLFGEYMRLGSEPCFEGNDILFHMPH